MALVLEVGMSHGGIARRYVLEVPEASVAAGAPGPGVPAAGWPLIVELHGRGIDPVGFDRWTGLSSDGLREGFATVMPEAIDGIWNDGRFARTRWARIDDVGFIRAVVDEVAARAPIDRRRVYVVGMSNGASMAGRLALAGEPWMAGIAQVAGTASAELVPADGSSRPLPILQIHGTADVYAPYEGGRAHGFRAVLALVGQVRAGPAIGVEAWADRWVRHNGAVAEPDVERLGDDTTIRRWHGATPASDVVFYRVEGAGHTWPGSRIWVPPIFGRRTSSFDASIVIWSFLRTHALG